MDQGNHIKHHKLEKLENPVRAAELAPERTLERIGLGSHDSICDIGAGSGIFTVPAARMTDGIVYALEIDDEMLQVIRRKAEEEGLENIRAEKVSDGAFPVDDDTVEFALLVTVLHEIDDKPPFIKELKRILKSGGKLSVIEFYGRETPMGPPLPHRISREDAVDALERAGFEFCDEFDLGENLYCMVFRNEE